jgi:hypothetical protein
VAFLVVVTRFVDDRDFLMRLNNSEAGVCVHPPCNSNFLDLVHMSMHETMHGIISSILVVSNRRGRSGRQAACCRSITIEGEREGGRQTLGALRESG